MKLNSPKFALALLTGLVLSLGLTQSFATGIAGTPLGVPDAPVITSVIAVDAATASTSDMVVTWTPPTNTGGSPLTGYTATATLGSAAYNCSISPTVSTPAATSEHCTISGLNFATTYSFTVVASNAVGTSLFSGAVSATTPGKVQHLVVSGVPDGSSVTYGVSDFQLTAVSQDVSNTATGLTSTWSVSTGSAGICSVDLNGYVHILGSGTCTVLADQNGSGSPYGPATQVATPITVNLNLTSTTISVNPATNIQGTSATVNATIPYPGATTTPTFCVTLTSSITPTCTLPTGVILGTYSPSVVTATSSTSVSALASGLQQGTKYYFWVMATPVGSSAVNSSSTLNFTTLSGPTLTLSGSNSGNVGSAMTLSFTASGGSGDYILWDKGTLPGGLSFTPGLTTATIAGTPTTIGSYTTFVSVTDSLNQQATLPVTINIAAAATPAPPSGGGTEPAPAPSPTPQPSPSPSPTPSPSASPTPTPTPQVSPSPKPSLTPAPTPSPSAVRPSSTPTPVASHSPIPAPSPKATAKASAKPSAKAKTPALIPSPSKAPQSPKATTPTPKASPSANALPKAAPGKTKTGPCATKDGFGCMTTTVVKNDGVSTHNGASFALPPATRGLRVRVYVQKEVP